MNKVKINGLIVEYYDGSIDELPAVRFWAFNRYLLIDANVGSDLSDIDKRILRVQGFIEKDKAKAYLELENLRQSLMFVIQRINPKHLAFACLVKSVNGIEYTDMSENGIKSLSERLNRVPQGFVARIVQAVKKKSKVK